MKKSAQVSVSLITALTASLVTTGGCSRDRDCVDSLGNRIPDAECRSGGRAGAHWIPRAGVQSGGFGTSGGSYGG